MNNEAFIPKIVASTNLVTCVQKTSANTSDSIVIPGREILVVAHTYPVYVRLGPDDVTVSAVNGLYIPVGVPLRFKLDKNVTKLAVINFTTDEHGVISVMPGLDE